MLVDSLEWHVVPNSSFQNVTSRQELNGRPLTPTSERYESYLLAWGMLLLLLLFFFFLVIGGHKIVSEVEPIEARSVVPLLGHIIGLIKDPLRYPIGLRYA
jgi:hypothetical protein